MVKITTARRSSLQTGAQTVRPTTAQMTVVISASMRESEQLSRIMNTTTGFALQRRSCWECTDQAPAAVAAPAATLGFVETRTPSPNVGSMCKIRRMRTAHVPLEDL